MLEHLISFQAVCKSVVKNLSNVTIVFWVAWSMCFAVQPLSLQAQSLQLPVLEWQVTSCPTLSEQGYEIEIDWWEYVKQWVEQFYTLRTSIPINQIETVEQEIWANGEFEQLYTTSAFRHSFDRVGSHLIKSFVTTRTWCRYFQQVAVEVFARSIVYIGTDSQEYWVVQDQSDDESVFFDQVRIEWSIIQQEDAVQQLLSEKIWVISSADAILVESELLGSVLWSIPQIQASSWRTVPLQNVYVLASIDQSLFRRLLWTYGTSIGLTTVRVVNPDALGTFLIKFSLWEDLTTGGLVQTYSVDTTWQSSRLVISKLVDYLLLKWVPLSFIIILLIIPVLALSITVYKQILWFATYGTYTTIFSWLIVEALWWQTALVFLLAWWVAVLLVWQITKRIYLLSNAKIWATIILYTLLLLWIAFAQTYIDTPIVSFELLWSFSLLFPILYILIVSNSLFGPKRSLWSLAWYIKFFQFAIVVGTVFAILNWTALQNIMLWYPELTLACFVLVLLVWRYTWLQLTEYFRFAPLISYVLANNDEEE